MIRTINSSVKIPRRLIAIFFLPLDLFSFGANFYTLSSVLCRSQNFTMNLTFFSGVFQFELNEHGGCNSNVNAEAHNTPNGACVTADQCLYLYVLLPSPGLPSTNQPSCRKPAKWRMAKRALSLTLDGKIWSEYLSALMQGVLSNAAYEAPFIIFVPFGFPEHWIGLYLNRPTRNGLRSDSAD
jgi:hypothetical protein